MMNSANTEESIYLSRRDTESPLASYALYPFELDGETWPSVEHYYQGMKFEQQSLRDQIISAADALEANKIADKNKRKIRKDWKKRKKLMMTRALYTMFKTHSDAENKLLSTGTNKLVENSQYDYYWGCGRDLRGDNRYGQILMEIRNKLKEALNKSG